MSTIVVFFYSIFLEYCTGLMNEEFILFEPRIHERRVLPFVDFLSCWYVKVNT